MTGKFVICTNDICLIWIVDYQALNRSYSYFVYCSESTSAHYSGLVIIVCNLFYYLVRYLVLHAPASFWFDNRNKKTCVEIIYDLYLQLCRM